MPRRQILTVNFTEDLRRKHWSLTVSGSNAQAKAALVTFVKKIAEDGNLAIVNGAEPFGTNNNQGELKLAEEKSQTEKGEKTDGDRSQI